MRALIGTIRRECLDRLLFRTATDLGTLDIEEGRPLYRSPYRSKEVRHDERLFEHFSFTVRTRCRHFEDVFRSHRIRPCDAIKKMIDTKGPVMFDCRVAALANCFPMIPSGKAHNEMLLGDDVTAEEVANAIGEEGKVLV